MGKQEETSEKRADHREDLNQYWFCPKDGNVLQIHHNRAVQSPNFDIYRENIGVGVNNAVASKRIPSDVIERTHELVDLMFNRIPSLKYVELVSVFCSSCKKVYAAPKQSRVDGLAKTQAQALFESHQALQTKNFGPFRFIDRYGVGQYLQRERNRGSRRWLFYILFIGIRTVAMILILYYIMGLEVKVGKKWVPLGIIMLALFVIGFIFVIVNSPLINILQS